jgi:hypothetical protein
LGFVQKKVGLTKIRQQKNNEKKLSQLVLFLSEHFDWRKAEEAGEQVQSTPENEMLIKNHTRVVPTFK